MSDPTIPLAPAPAPPSSYTASTPSGVPVDAYNRERDRAAQAEAALTATQAELKKYAALNEETKASVTRLSEAHNVTEASRKKLEDDHRALRISTAVRVAAMEHGAVDPEDVVSLLASRFTLNDAGNAVTADDTKEPVAAAVKSFLERKPHLARARVAQGSGASPFPQPAPIAAAPVQHDMRTREGATASLRDMIFRAKGLAPDGSVPPKPAA